MKVAEVIQALQAFFLDFIGAIIPGCILLVGIAVALDSAEVLGSAVDVLGGFAWLGLVVSTYTLGNIYVGVGDWATKKRQEKVRTELRRDPSVVRFEQVALGRSGLAELGGQTGAMTFGALRNLALSVASDGASLAHRFMFIYLFHLGASFALIISVLSFWIAAILQRFGAVYVLENPDYSAAAVWTIVAAVAIALMMVRWHEFYKRSMRIPFSNGIAHFLKEGEAEGSTGQGSPAPRGGLRAGPVYLAGGFRSGWQDTVMERVRHLAFFDPRSHGLVSEEAYTAWDLQALRQSQVVLAYAESSNPGLYALSLEIGFAKALGKQIILVEQHPDESRARYFGMLRACSDVRFESLDDAIRLLSQSTSPTFPS